MRSLKILPIMLLLLLVASSLPAVAGTIVFNSTDGNSYQGVPTFPYNFTMNGHSAALMCIDWNNHITYGESWQVTAMPIPADPLYEQAAWLYLQAVKDGGTDSNINGAVWSLFATDVPMTPSAAAWIALAEQQNFTAGEFRNVTMYVPTSDQTGWTVGVPQTFLGSTPEPSTLVTLGAALIGVAALARKRLLG